MFPGAYDLIILDLPSISLPIPFGFVIHLEVLTEPGSKGVSFDSNTFEEIIQLCTETNDSLVIPLLSKISPLM